MYHNTYCDKNTKLSPKNLVIIFHKFTKQTKKKETAKFIDDTYRVAASAGDLLQCKSVKNGKTTAPAEW